MLNFPLADYVVVWHSEPRVIGKHLWVIAVIDDKDLAGKPRRCIDYCFSGPKSRGKLPDTFDPSENWPGELPKSIRYLWEMNHKKVRELLSA